MFESLFFKFMQVQNNFQIYKFLILETQKQTNTNQIMMNNRDQQSKVSITSIFFFRINLKIYFRYKSSY